MRKRLFWFAAPWALAAAAMAGPLSPTADVDSDGSLPGPGSDRNGIDVPLDITGTGSWDLLGDRSNTVLVIDLASELGLPAGSPVTMTGIGWDVFLRTVGDSWLSEARIYFDDNVNPDQVGLFLTVGFGDDFPGNNSYSSGGVIKLADAGIPDIALPDGNLRIEFYEQVDNFPNSLDARWAGTLTIQAVPEPGALSLLALAGLRLLRRR